MNRGKRFKEEGSSPIIYIIGGVLGIIMLSIIVVFFAYASKIKKNDNSKQAKQHEPTEIVIDGTERASTEIGKSINEVKNEAANVVSENAVINSQTQNKVATSETKEEEVVTTSTKVEEEKKIEFIYPVEGEIIKEFAKDNLVYSETLKEWTTHTGIDIAADKTTVVKSSLAGEVIAIKNDPRYGLTVIIEHEDGYKTVYSNLLTAEFVEEGQRVETGETIGTVGTSAIFESADEPHVHFEILKDNEYLDPAVVLKK